jgi:replicative DNA helicase
VRREPPANLEAESAVLGAMLSAPSAVTVALDRVCAEDFYRDTNRHVFTEIVSAWNRDPACVDVVTVGAALPEQRDYLHALLDSVPTVSNVAHYAEIVKHTSVCRALIKAGQEVEAIGYEDGEDAATLMDRAEAKVFGVRPDGSGKMLKASSIAHIIGMELANHVSPDVVSSGYQSIDDLSGGFYPGNLIIIGARPGMGKSMVGLNVAHRVSEKRNVLFFSLEMSRYEIGERLICLIACIPVMRVRQRSLNEEENQKFMRAMPIIEQRSLTIIDDPGLSLLSLKSQCRQFAARSSIGLIVIDYLQLMKLGRRTESRTAEVSEISRELKIMARELKCPILALSQLNRESQFATTEDKAPKISQLRESGSLEQDADMVWLLSWGRNEFNLVDRISIDIAKNRSGRQGKLLMTCDAQYQRMGEAVTA